MERLVLSLLRHLIVAAIKDAKREAAAHKQADAEYLHGEWNGQCIAFQRVLEWMDGNRDGRA